MPEARARTEPMEVVPPGNAWSRLQEYWESFRTSLDNGDLATARQDLVLVKSAKWDGALGDLAVHGIALIRLAENFRQQGDPETAQWLVQSAEELAPGAVKVQLALARYHLGGGTVDPARCVSHYLKIIEVQGSDFPTLYRLLGRLTIGPVIFLGLMGSLFGLVMIVRYGTLLAHDFAEIFPAGNLPIYLSRALVALFLLLPLAAGLSFWWLIGWWFIILSIYMQRSEKALAYLWFISLIAAPWLLEKHCVFAGTRSDRVLQAALRVRNGVVRSGDLEILEEEVGKRPDDVFTRFCLAQLLQREGRFNKAVSYYHTLLKDPRTAQEAYNNIAEIYLWDGDLKTVFKALSAAMEKGPQRVEIVFNLGQYYQEAEELTRMEDEYQRARLLDEEKLDHLLERAGEWRLNRFMAQLPAPRSLVWERSVRGSPLASASFAGVWNKWMGQPSGIAFLATSLGALVSLFVLQLFSKKWDLSFRCSSCGRPICEKCGQGPSKDPDICKPCYSVFRGEGGVDLKEKMQKRSEVQRYRDNWSRAGMATSLLLPGSGQAAMGWTVTGLLFATPIALILAGYLSGRLAWPDPGPYYSGGVSGYGIILVFIYILLMIVSLLVFRSRADRGR